ncbi:MAG: AarF/UbiB family protein, partial [Candidatus Promineifilaceae bacterium]|nr:AarF/UbiB family protein [Candidatus Promineifilaceae bacterium]
GRETLRLRESYNIITTYGLDFLLGRGPIRRTRAAFLEKLYGVPKPEREISIPIRARYMLQELGPIYVKIGQLISSQSQALPEEWVEEFSKLQSNVPPFPYEQVREIVISELKGPPEEIYATFDPLPLAAASTAQVHRATRRDGVPVVVKVQRPGIKQQIKSDVGIMEWLANLAARRLQWARDMNLVGLIDEFGSQVLLEVDYRIEAYNAIRLNQNLAEINGVRMPFIDEELSTERLVTMEYIDGFKITDLRAIEAAGFDLVTLAENAMKVTVKMILIDGFFHGDMHPGNVLVQRDTGEIILLDTGMVGELDTRQRMNIISMLYAFNEKDVHGLALTTRSFAVPFRQVDEKLFRKDFERRVGHLMYKKKISFPPIFTEVIEVMRDNGLQFDPSLTLAVKSIMQMETISSLLFEGGGLVEQGMCTVRQLVREQITVEKASQILKREVTYALREVSGQIPSLQEATASWLNQYKKGRFEIFINTSQLNKQIETAGNILRLLIIVILVASTIIGSSIALGIAAAFDIEGELKNFIGIGVGGYCASIFLAVLVILFMLWQLWRARKRYRV